MFTCGTHVELLLPPSPGQPSFFTACTNVFHAINTVTYCGGLFQSDEVFLEAQIQNITPGPIYMERVSLEPSSQYTARELNSPDGKEG